MKAFAVLLALVALWGAVPACGGEASAGVAHESATAERAPGGGSVADPDGEGAEPSGPTIAILGDSLTAGYGLDHPEYAYPALIEERLRAEGRPGRVINAGISYDTTETGLSRLGWTLRQHVDVLVVALGGNDGLRGIGTEEMEANLRQIVAEAREQEPPPAIVLAGMLAVPNMGATYADAYREVFPRVAHDLDLSLIPFLLEGVGGVPELNQGDGLHPNRDGQVVVAENVWAVLRPLLEDLPES